MTAIEPLRERADVAMRERRLDDALIDYRRLAEAEPTNSTWWWRIARAHELRQDAPGCDEAIRRALALDGGASTLDERLLRAGPFELRSRRRITKFVRANLDRIRALAATLDAPAPAQGRRLFVYWGQDFAAAPPIVQRCLAEVRRHHAPDDLVLLTDANRDEWARVPDDVTSAIGDDRTKLSDALRLELLWRHGGVWLDATCLPVADVLAETASRPGFFAFELRPRRPSSWLLSAPPGNPVVGLLCAAQRLYWTHFGGPRAYYAIHQLFEALVLLDEDFRREWRESPRPSADPPHALQRMWNQPYDDASVDHVLRRSWVHKLTYKYDAAEAAPGTILDRLLTTGLVAP
jgi:hypothetical protein